MIKDCIGLVEWKTVPVAVRSLDEMMKAAEIEVVFASPVCPGKYVAIIAGTVSNVKTSVRAGELEGGIFCLSSLVLPNIHPAVFPALTGIVSCVQDNLALGLLESMSAITAVRAADVAAKAADVEIVEVRLARGLGGKSFITITGDVSAVKTAIRNCEVELQELGDIVSTAVIPNPAKGLSEFI